MLDPERGEQRAAVAGELLEGELVAFRLTGFAEADLVRRYHAIAGAAERLDGAVPGRGAEILAVQQHRGLVVRRRRLDVEIGHVELLPLRAETIMLDRIGIVETLQFRSVG